MPVSTVASARDEITLHFTTKWNAGIPPIPILLYDDKHRDLPTDDHYARLLIRHNLGRQSTIGARKSQGGDGIRYRHFGIITVQVFTISGDGLTKADDLVELALDAFESEKTGLDRVEFRNARINEIGQDGPWFQTNVIAEFNYDRTK